MTRRDLDPHLLAWFDDGPTAMPDRVLDVVADRIGRQPQRRARRLPGGIVPVTPQLKALAALAAALVIAFTGWSLLPRTSGGGTGPTTEPTPTLVPTPSPSPTAAAYACDDPAFRCAGELAAGTVSSAAFKPHFSLTIPAGWANSLDRERTYNLKPDDGTMFVQVLSQVAIPEQNATCTAQRKAGAGTAVADFVTFFTTNPGLVATAPVPVTVGGYAGSRVTVHVSPTWTARCPNSIGPAVMLLTDTVATPDRSIRIDDQYTTMFILDVAGTTVIVRLESGPSQAAADRDLARMQPVIDSLTFTPGA